MMKQMWLVWAGAPCRDDAKTKVLPSAGESYTGGWFMGEREGFGCQTLANGCQYTGEWQKGMKHGRCSVSLALIYLAIATASFVHVSLVQ